MLMLMKLALNDTFFCFKQAAIAAGGAAIAAGFAAIFNMRKGGSSETATAVVEKEEELPPIDVSIPYNSAALLAFDEWKGDKIFPEDTFAKFETIYEEKVVTMVTAKKVQRELDDALTKAESELAKLAKMGEEPASESE